MTRFEKPVNMRRVEREVMTVEKMNANMDQYVKEYLNQK
jgi:cob(I)alamin adenosyltransferase